MPSISDSDAMNQAIGRTEEDRRGFSKRELHRKFLWILISTLIGALLIIIIILIVLKKHATDAPPVQKTSNVCSSPDCRNAAERMIRLMDTAIDPCDDFFEFACGALRNYKFRSRFKDRFTSQVQKRIQSILEHKMPTTADQYYQLPAIFYEKCKKPKQKTKWYSAILRELELCLVNNTYDWLTAIKILRKYGYPHALLFQVQVTYVEKRPDLLIQPPVNFLLNYGQKTPNQLLNDSGIKVDKFFDEFYKTKALAIMLSKIKGKSSLPPEHIDMKQLQLRVPYINWISFLTDILPKDIHIDARMKLYSYRLDYFDGLVELLKRTDSLVIYKYFAYNVIMLSLEFLEFRDIKTCYLRATKALKLPLIKLYIEKYHIDKKVPKLDSIAHDMRQAYKRVLNYATWLDDQTRAGALTKLDNIKMNMGYDASLLQDDIMEQLYDFKYRLLKNPMSSSNMLHLQEVNPFETNAFYIDCLQMSDLVLHIGLIDSEILGFFQDLPYYIHYGNVGSVLGHEMSHAFDEARRDVNHLGINDSYWRPDALRLHKMKTECFRRQFNCFIYEHTGLSNGYPKIVNEVLSDNAGFQVAYEAYRTIASGHDKPPPLEGLKQYSPNQMFWMSAVLTFCFPFDASKLINFHGNHPPGKFRVNYTLRNNANFSKDFNCTPGKPMNPEKKCDFW